MTDERLRNGALLALALEEGMLLEPREQFDAALVGYIERFGGVECPVYDRAKVIEILAEQFGGSVEGAWEWYGYNTLGAWVGEGTPAFLVSMDSVEERYGCDLETE